MKKYMVIILTFIIILFGMVVNVNATKQSKTKDKMFWEGYILYNIVEKNEVEPIAIDTDWAEHMGYYDKDIYLKGMDYYPKKKVTFTFPSSVKHEGIKYIVSRLPDYECNKFIEIQGIDIVANGGGNYNPKNVEIN